MKPCACAAVAAARTCSSVASGTPKAMLSRTLSEKRKLSSGTSPMAARKEDSVSSRTSSPPTRTAPPETS